MADRPSRPGRGEAIKKGKLNQILGGMLFDTPELSGAKDVTNEIDPANEINSEGASPETYSDSVIQPPHAEKPGFWSNLLSGGRAGQQAANLNNQIKIADYENILKKALLNQRLTGEQANRLSYLDQETARRQAEMEAKNAQEQAMEDAKYQHDLDIKRNTEALLHGYPDWNTYQQILSNPDVMTSALVNTYANNEKQGLENLKTQAQTAEINAGLPTKPYVQIPEGNALLNAATREVIRNNRPLEVEPAPGYGGGVVSRTLGMPGSGSGGPVATPGGVNAEINAALQAKPKTSPPPVNYSFDPTNLGQPIQLPSTPSQPSLFQKAKDYFSSPPIPQAADPFSSPPTEEESQPSTPIEGAFSIGSQPPMSVSPFQQQQQPSTLDKFRWKMKLLGVPGF